MRLSVSADFSDVQRRLDALQADVRERALVRAVNRTIEQARTEMSRRIREEFNLKASTVREKLFIRRAGFKQGRLVIEASLSSRAANGRRSINIVRFDARQTAAGLTAKIKRSAGRVLVSSSGFIANKGRTAFRRVGKKRLPIKPLQTIDVPQMFNTRRIKEAVIRKVREIFPAVAAREVAFYARAFNR